jgi:quercetin dioxygenase-like cupin family protein
MDVQNNYFSDESKVLAEIEAAGYFPLKMDFPAEINDDHWHDFDSTVYILDGELIITDSETNESCVCTRGTKIVAPSGELHREKSGGHCALVGFSIDPEELTQPVNKPPPVSIA